MIGQPNVRERRLDNPVTVPLVLSVLAFGHTSSEVQGLADFPERDWPDNIELLYYAFHIMAGLGTILIAIMVAANLLSWLGRLEKTGPMLWVLMLAFPFPYIAVIAGWVTTELGRQPWLVYGLFRTAQGSSPTVHSGTALFTLLGFCGLYLVLGVLFLFLISREIGRGPSPEIPQREAAHA
jgi:cytochrome d ubiquinol oxidase subunit I